jgi:hypothetical protein
MGLDIGSNLITQASSVLTVDTGVPMRLLSTGPVARPNQCQFLAIGNQATTWVNFTQGTWNVMPFPTTEVNINTCFNTTTSRFTAPVTGMYFFQVCCWILKDGANDGYYWHPCFAVNGDLGGRAVNTAYPNYRIRGYGWPGATYETTGITEVYSLTVGDYVEHQVYSTGAPTNRYHSPYQRFTGFLLG